MKITQLDIRDFGVFQGEKLEDLGSGIIVIGGANRSGKTTLMQVLRNIPFGFSKNSGIPPAKFQYNVRCDLLLDDGNGVNVLLKGFSNPEIVYNNATDNKANKGLYNIDKSAYRELFTISLDELNKSSGKEDSNLQSMLLGAGFKHIAKIPGVAKELREKANTIGGTRGNPSTKMFKPFTENIKKGVEGRKKSISMLDTFAEKKNSLSHLQATIISKEKQLEISNNNIIKLDILRHNYELNQDRKNIEGELQTYFFSHSDIKEYNIEKAKTLKTQYIKELEQYNNDNNGFQREIITEKPMKELLLGSKDLISDFYNGISGIKEMNKNLLSEKNEYYEKTQLLMNKIKKSNDNWSSFKGISEINCDEVQQCILIQNIEKFKKAEYDRALCDKRSGDLKIQREILEKQIVTCDSATYMKKYFYLTISFMILGLALFFIDKLLGCSLIIIGAIGSALYLFINYSNSKLIINRNIEIKTQIENRSGDISNNSQEIISLDEDLRELNNIMDEYRDILKLDGRVSVEGIKDYFKTVSYLKDEISEYYLLKKKLSSHFNTLNESLSSIGEVLKKFTEFNTKNPEEINLDNIENICSDILLKLEELYKHLILVEKAHESYLKLNMVEHEILGLLGSNYLEDIILNIEKYISQGEKYIKYLNMQNELKIIQEKLLQSVKSQRIKKILYDGKVEAAPSDDANLLKILENLYREYINIDELTYEYEGLNAEIKELIGQLDILKNEKQTLKDELLALNSDEMLVQYDKEIRQARGHLRPLAEKYAVYNTAALLLEKIREKFLESTKDKLLKGASDILSEITSGEYKDIVPMEDLMQGDFKTVLRDESVKESSRELSRGTKEQLFLAVRISRIKEIKPSLPVILDDSFVNFDIAHTKNTVKALVQLSKTHQIFVLTCHATLVELINDLEKQAQYFKLDKGKFEKSTGGDLKKYLKEL
ncbi:AAA family ATPase [Clostridium sp. CM028]|uniref:AAA family ATPase n=1 Tax=unclassified Clostridium TaxID=2614128 RepID=UPI001C6E6F61|nr:MULTISPECIES: AAA family ATPase [unclassified Clostridium]MBW9144418.1 AAA family ATPase [Clostridium sp. CM027]MBW9149346.1 AAA family ATPase [Clostridium sp. CM028]UVE40956.1 AAA family ATPase [Clostridium sp. CM027]WLC61624.1 AAA family ATPase [Clostridium sp. CM028]